MPGWTTKALLKIAAKILGNEHTNEPFSLARIGQSARRVLIVPAKGLAEILLTYPALSLLRKSLPESRIVCLVEGAQAEVLRNFGIVDEFVELPRFAGARGLFTYKAFVKTIRERMAEAAFCFDFRQDFHRIMLPMLSGARLRFKLKDEIGYPLFNVEVIPSHGTSYLRDLNISLVRFLADKGMRYDQWHLPEKEVRIAREIIRLRKPDPSDLLVALDLSYTKSGDRPPFEVEVRLARSFAALRPAKIILLGDPEPAISEEEIRELGPYDWLRIPQKTFRDTLGILSQCDLFISANTNLFHFAICMNVPVYGLFSNKDEVIWIPPDGCFELIDEKTWQSMPPARLAMRMRDFLEKVLGNSLWNH